MEDIEDLIGLDVDVPRHRNSVMPRVRRRKKTAAAAAAAKEVNIYGKVLVTAHTLPSPPNKLGDLVGMRGFGCGT